MKKVFYFFSFTIFYFLIFVPIIVQAFSIAPSELRIENIHKDYSVEKKITVGISDVEDGSTIYVEKSGEGANFIHLPVTEFTKENGETRKEFSIVIDPVGAEIGKEYEAKVFVYVYFSPVGGQVSGVETRAGLEQKIYFKVTNQKERELKIKDLDFFSQSDWGDFSFLGVNSGNVEEEINKIKIKVIKEGGKVEEDVVVLEKEVQINKKLPASNYVTIEGYLEELKWLQCKNYRVELALEKDGLNVKEMGYFRNLEERVGCEAEVRKQKSINWFKNNFYKIKDFFVNLKTEVIAGVLSSLFVVIGLIFFVKIKK